MNHQKQIRLRLIDLVERHGNSFNKCKGCPLCKEIMQIRKKLEREPAERFKYILDKGEDMTKSDIAFLLENKVTLKQIKQVLKITDSEFWMMMYNFGFSKRKQPKSKKKEEMEMAKATPGIYQDYKAKGLNDKQIAQELGIAPAYLSQLKKKWFGSTAQPTTAKETKAENNNTPEKQNDKSAEYERLIASLRNDLNDLTSQLDEKDEQLRNQAETIVSQIEKTKKLHQELAELREVCEDQAAEILTMKQPVEDTETLRLLEENKALRQLLKLLM